MRANTRAAIEAVIANPFASGALDDATVCVLLDDTLDDEQRRDVVDKLVAVCSAVAAGV